MVPNCTYFDTNERYFHVSSCVISFLYEDSVAFIFHISSHANLLKFEIRSISEKKCDGIPGYRKEDIARDAEIPFVYVKVRKMSYNCLEKPLKMIYFRQSFSRRGSANQILIS